MHVTNIFRRIVFWIIYKAEQSSCMAFVKKKSTQKSTIPLFKCDILRCIMASIRQELGAIQERLRSEIALKQLEIEAVSTTIGIVSREEDAAKNGKPAAPVAEAASTDPKGNGWAEKIPPVNLKEALTSGKQRW